MALVGRSSSHVDPPISTAFSEVHIRGSRGTFIGGLAAMPVRLPACDPCRSTKSACDHTKPVCSRCRERDQAACCTYRDAPFQRHNKRTRLTATTRETSRSANSMVGISSIPKAWTVKVNAPLAPLKASRPSHGWQRNLAITPIQDISALRVI